MDSPDWLSHFEAELEMAEAARQRGNEGMARVCARRAVGWLLGDYFQRRGVHFHDPSAIERLKKFQSLPGVHPDLLEISEHFLTRVNEDYQLSIDADLIAEARLLKLALTGQTFA